MYMAVIVEQYTFTVKYISKLVQRFSFFSIETSPESRNCMYNDYNHIPVRDTLSLLTWKGPSTQEVFVHRP